MKGKKIVCLLLLAALLCALCACGKNTPPLPAPTPPAEPSAPVPSDIVTPGTPSPAVTERPEPTPAVTPVPQKPPVVSLEEERELAFTVEGSTETVSAKLCSWDRKDGPGLALYVDELRYETQVVYVDEDDASPIYRVYPLGWDLDAPELPYLELRFVPGKDAAELAPGLLDRYDEALRALEDEGTVSFAGRAARLVKGESAENLWRAWVFDSVQGAVALVLHYTPASAEGHAVRLTAMADTLQILPLMQ